MKLSQHIPSGARFTNGFTLVELVVVIVIVAILAAIAMPKFFDNRAFAERGFYEEVVAAVKFAQKRAVATGCPVRMALTAAGYEARQQQALGGSCDRLDASFATPVVLSDGQRLAASAPAGVVMAPAVTFTFDALGGTSLGADQTITVGAYPLTVQARSGYVDTP